jgi:molybdopterin converting factor small subunit
VPGAGTNSALKYVATPYSNTVQMNPITVHYFGDLMARLGIGRENLRLPASVKDVAGIMKLLAVRGGDWQQAFGQARPTLRIMVDKRDADTTTPVSAGAEVAFIESVSL